MRNYGLFNSLDIMKFNGVMPIIKIDNEGNIDKYMTKKLLSYGDEIYYCSLNSNLFCYNTKTGETSFYKTGEALASSPVYYDGKIYFFDRKGNMYRFEK